MSVSNIVKEYPTMLKVIIYHESYDLPNQENRKQVKKENRINKQIENIHRSVRRSRMSVKDIMLSNRFDLWCTFTYNCRDCHPKCLNSPCTCNPSTCTRYNLRKVTYKLTTWFRNQRKHSPNLKYLAVFEKHKNGAYHAHVLLQNFNGTLKETNKKTKHGQKIYNARGYYQGWTEFVKIGERADTIDFDTDYARIISYISKYINKDMDLVQGRKRYLCSQGLDRPTSFVNGVDVFRLNNMIRNNKPDYIDDILEVQTFKTQGRILTQSKQTELRI